MPQPSYAYGVARVRASEGRLLGRDKLERMLEAASGDEALRVLAETDYAQAAAELRTSYDYEQLLKGELRRTYEFIRTVTPKVELTNLFLIKYDIHNLKVLLKNRYLESEDDALLVDMGTLPIDHLKRALGEKDYRELPKPVEEALEKLDELFSLEPDPQQIDLVLDRAMFDWIFATLKKNPNDFLQRYFEAQVDLINIRSFLRVKKLEGDERFLEELLLPNGKIPTRLFVESLEGSLEDLMERLAHTEYRELVEEGIQSYVKTGRLTRFETLMDDYLIRYVRDRRWKLFSIEPIIGYLIAKESEIQAIRIVMVGLINGINRDTIRERLRELYV